MEQDLINLVDNAKNGSYKSFVKLYHKYRPLIWSTIYNIVKNVDVTDDLTSIVFTKAYQRLNTYTNHISFEHWLKTIAVNSSIDFIRKSKYEKLNNYIDDENYNFQVKDNYLSPEDEMIMKEKLDLIYKTLPTLKKKYRLYLEERLNGVSYKDIAEKYNTNEDNVKCVLNKARKTLKRIINNII